MSWLEMPAPVLESYVARLPALEAEASMRRATEMAAGSGRLKKADHDRVWGGWQRLARDGGAARGNSLVDAATLLDIPVVKSA